MANIRMKFNNSQPICFGEMSWKNRANFCKKTRKFSEIKGTQVRDIRWLGLS
jgi:hypothetical protein